MPRSKTRTETERRCIVSGETRPRDALIRFVIGPDEQVVPDVDGRLPGRGMWLSADRAAIATACKKRLFAKAAKRRVNVPDSLADDIETLLLERCLRRIGLARRAGEAVAGFERVAEWLRRQEAKPKGGLLLDACDGAADGRRKTARLAEAVSGIAAISCFNADELGRAMGLDRAVHVAVSRGGNADALREDAARLQGVRRVDAAANGNECLQPNA